MLRPRAARAAVALLLPEGRELVTAPQVVQLGRGATALAGAKPLAGIAVARLGSG